MAIFMLCVFQKLNLAPQVVKMTMLVREPSGPVGHHLLVIEVRLTAV